MDSSDLPHDPGGLEPLVFLHNPKAGGTSLAALLRAGYPETSVAPILESSPHEREGAPWVAHQACRFVAGHFGHEVRVNHFPGHGLLTNFRHPATRLWSLYQFWRHGVSPALRAQLPAENGPHYAQTLSFAEFVASDRPFLRLYLENFHTRQLLDSGWIWWDLTPGDLHRAQSRVDEMRWYYVAEWEPLSLAWLRSEFPDLPVPDAPPRLNQTAAPAGPPPDWRALGLALERNRMDVALYLHALERLGERARAAAGESR
jgi:hypothetical protein